MTAPDAFAPPSSPRLHALDWAAPNEPALGTGQGAIQEAHSVEPRRRPESVARWLRPRRPRSGWHAYRPEVDAQVPSWALELTLTIERPFTSSNDTTPAPRALLLARATRRWRPLAHALSVAMRELDSIAGVSPPLPGFRLVRPHPEAGLDPLPRLGVLTHLRGASERGRAIGRRRARALEAGFASWEPGAGAVLTCTGRVGVSAQAVIALAGHGDLAALCPPPGGATVLRAWRWQRRRKAPDRFAAPHTEWALASGIVLGSATGVGLGRVARRYAVLAQSTGWSATVLTGAAALEIARAGDPRYPPPRTTARPVSHDALTEMLGACLGAASEAARPALPGK
jgi:hypothetical protein